MHRKILLTCVATAALAAFAIVPTLAAASPTLCETEGGVCKTITAPQKVFALNIGDVVMTDTGGNVITRCSVASITGELVKNTGTVIEATIETASFNGTGSGSVCTVTGIPSGALSTPKVANGLPWCLQATNMMAGDEFQIRGGKCSEAAREIRFGIDIGATACLYRREAPMVGSLTTHSAPGEDAILTLNKQGFSGVSTPFPCPTSGTFDMSFTLETDKSLMAEPLYID